MSGEHRGAQLAERFRMAIDQEAQRKQALKEELRKRLEQREAERTALLKELYAFGKTVGHFDATSKLRGRQTYEVTWTYGGGALTFRRAKSPEDGIEVVSPALDKKLDTTLQWSAELGRWLLVDVREHHLPQRRVLFDEGLKDLIQRAFGLEPAAEGEVAEAPPATTLDDAVPGLRSRKL